MIDFGPTASLGSNGQSDLGSGQSYGRPGDVSRSGGAPASASWLFAVLIFRM
jgi:hypothetical protein